MKKWHSWLIGLSLLLLPTACGGPRMIRTDEDTKLARVSFAPDGDSFLLEDIYNQFVQLRAFPGGELHWRLEEQGSYLRPTALAFSPDGSEVALPYDERVHFYAAEDGSPVGEIDLGDDVLYVPFLIYRPDDTLAVAVIRKGEETPSAENPLSVEIWSRAGERLGEPVLVPPCPTFMYLWLPFTPDGSRFAYVVKSHIVGIVDLAEGKSWEWNLAEPLHWDDYPNELPILSLAVSPDGREIALALLPRPNNTLSAPPIMMRVAADTGQVLAMLSAPEGLRDQFQSGWSLAYSPDERFLALELYEPKALVLYNLEEETEPRVLCEGEKCCSRMPAFSFDGRTLATVCWDQVALWEVP